ncbi:hypothetical protein BH10CYA1_BH10CYA1_12090 [soil metagenome]
MAKRKKDDKSGGLPRNLSSDNTQAKPAAFEAKVVYQRARWKHGMRIFGIVLMVVLNVSLVMSDVERANNASHFSLPHELVTYLALILLDTTVLMPLLFEVDKIEVFNESIVLNAIFWKAKLKWEDIQYFKLPPMLKFAVLKSQRCYYLINKRDIKQFAELYASVLTHQDQFKLKEKT